VFLGLFVAVVPHLIVGPALLLVGQHLFGLLDLLELLFGIGVVADVRMVPPVAFDRYACLISSVDASELTPRTS